MSQTMPTSASASDRAVEGRGRPVPELARDRQDDQLRHQLNGVARRPMLAGLLEFESGLIIDDGEVTHEAGRRPCATS
jgi:hypothetical protein